MPDSPILGKYKDSDTYIIRKFREADAYETGILISDTYRKYNLDHINEDDIEPYLDSFYNCRSENAEHRRRIRQLIDAPLVLVAESKGRIAGVIRGSVGRLHSLFVHEDFHRRGIASGLLGEFEKWCADSGSKKITLSASLYAVPFYKAAGYKKSTGVRHSRSFEGTDFYVQPMKKLL